MSDFYRVSDPYLSTALEFPSQESAERYADQLRLMYSSFPMEFPNGIVVTVTSNGATGEPVALTEEELAQARIAAGEIVPSTIMSALANPAIMSALIEARDGTAPIIEEATETPVEELSEEEAEDVKNVEQQNLATENATDGAEL
jgi:hypothetical protein